MIDQLKEDIVIKFESVRQARSTPTLPGWPQQVPWSGYDLRAVRKYSVTITYNYMWDMSVLIEKVMLCNGGWQRNHPVIAIKFLTFFLRASIMTIQKRYLSEANEGDMNLIKKCFYSINIMQNSMLDLIGRMYCFGPISDYHLKTLEFKEESD